MGHLVAAGRWLRHTWVCRKGPNSIKRSGEMLRTTCLVVLGMMVSVVQAEVVFEDDFNRTTGLGPNWSYGGANPAKVYINAAGQLRLDEAGPVYYVNPIATGAPGTKQAIEFTLVQPSPSGYIGCYVTFGWDPAQQEMNRVEYIWDYTVGPRMYIRSYKDGVGTNDYNGYFPDLRGRNALVVIDVETDMAGVTSASVSAFQGDTLLASTGKVVTSKPITNGYVGFALPNNYWSGLIVDNLKISQVPEPASMCLLGLGSLGVLLRRKR